MILAAIMALAQAGTADAPPADGIRWLDCTSFATPGHPRTFVDRIAFIAFDSGGTVINALGRQWLDVYARSFDAPAGCGVVIEGHADRVGPEDRNMALSLRRARAVERYLRRRGLNVPVRLEPHGETRLLVETADEVAEPQNRRVTVYVPDYPFVVTP